MQTHRLLTSDRLTQALILVCLSLATVAGILLWMFREMAHRPIEWHSFSENAIVRERELQRPVLVFFMHSAQVASAEALYSVLEQPDVRLRLRFTRTTTFRADIADSVATEAELVSLTGDALFPVIVLFPSNLQAPSKILGPDSIRISDLVSALDQNSNSSLNIEVTLWSLWFVLLIALVSIGYLLVFGRGEKRIT